MPDERTTTASAPVNSASSQVEAKLVAGSEPQFVASRRTMRLAVTAGALITAAWLGVFAAGALVSSEPFRESLGAYAEGWRPVSAQPGTPAASGRLDERTTVIVPPGGRGDVGSPGAAPPGARVSGWRAAGALVLAGMVYTPTNLAVLCCFAALVGCIGGLVTNTTVDSRIRDERAASFAKIEGGEIRDATPQFQIAGRAVTWGFFVYLVVISGSMVLSSEGFQGTTPGQYLRLAGAASLFAFVIGWQPRLLQDLVSRVGAQRVGSVQGK